MTEGVAWVSSPDEVLATAQVGAEVSTSGPPWVVIHRTPADVIVSRWPGRLLRVSGLAAVDVRVEAAVQDANSGFGAGVPHTRVARARVLEELPPGRLFGPRGDRVVPVLDRAAALSTAEASRLAAALPGEADATYDAVLQRWDGESGSPVGYALSVCHQEVHSRALLHGAARPDLDEDGADTGWFRYDEPWDGAEIALRCAVLGLGAIDVEPAERAVLTRAWDALTSHSA